jgi:hypothetical protein
MLMLEQVRSAASPEGMIILAIIYFIIWVFSKVGKQKRRAQEQAEAQQYGTEVSSGDATQQEGLSLERILRQIEEVKRQAEEKERQAQLPQPRPQLQPRKDWRSERLSNAGPMGRHSRTQLEAEEEVEELETLETGSIEVEEEIENLDSRVRQRIDQDEQAEAVVQRRIAEAQARNRAHRGADHKAFDKRIREPAPETKVERRYSAKSMRDAFVWREILGPPKALE